MDVFIKSFASYRTIKKASAITSVLILDSLDAETSSVTVTGTEIGRGNTGDWALIGAEVYQISAVNPKSDRTILTLTSPLDAFSRPLELEEQTAGQTIGGFVHDCLHAHWLNCEDPVYAVPYLTVSNSDTTPFTAPEIDNGGCFELPEYCRLIRKSTGISVQFSDAGDTLKCTIQKASTGTRQVSFEDGRSQLHRVDYAASGVAKITALHEVDTGEKDSEGKTITEIERTIWYLSESGEISREVPVRRAAGKWETITVSKNTDVETKVKETFAKNKSNHKLEFWSTLDLKVQDDCTFLVYGELLQSYISYKRKSSTDKRFYYKSGELATTATEKLRKGVTK